MQKVKQAGPGSADRTSCGARPWLGSLRRGLVLLGLVLSLGLNTACGTGAQGTEAGTRPEAQEQRTGQGGGRHLIFGDPTFNEANDIVGVNPQEGYSGWACLRYGVGETLFRFDEEMRAQPWLAVGLKARDPLSWELELRPGISFSDGQPLSAGAVQACLERLLKQLERARELLPITSMEAPDGAGGLRLILHTERPLPSLQQLLGDPMTCMVEARALDAGKVLGTGPFTVQSLEPNRELILERNSQYWGGPVRLAGFTVRSFSDGQSLQLALQAGDIQGAQSVPYAAYPELRARGFGIDQVETSRCFFMQWNLRKDLAQEAALREAVNLALSREDFCQKLLQANAQPAAGPFPQQLAAAPKQEPPSQDLERARSLLEEAGWRDSDGDGWRERGGQRLSLKLLTYPSRPELPVLANYAADCLRRIGVELKVEVSQEYKQRRKDDANWDLLASSMVTAPLGESSYFFRHVLTEKGVGNYGGFHDARVERLVAELEIEADEARRRSLTAELLGVVAEQRPCIFVAHLRMALVSAPSVEGLRAWPSDFYIFDAQTGLKD